MHLNKDISMLTASSFVVPMRYMLVCEVGPAIETEAISDFLSWSFIEKGWSI